MSRKTSPRRIAAFFAALEESGNQTLAAERARVSRSWVSLHRASTPGFRERMDAAIATARERLGGAASVEPGDPRWRFQGGEELVVRGARSGKSRIARARLDGMNPRAEKRFLAMMAASGSAGRACRAARVSMAAAYNHRKRWPAFGIAWRRAERIAVFRLDDYLCESAQIMIDTAFDRPDGDYAPGEEPMMPIPPDMRVPEILDILDWLSKRHIADLEGRH